MLNAPLTRYEEHKRNQLEDRDRACFIAAQCTKRSAAATADAAGSRSVRGMLINLSEAI
jgi:hypothetical protein